MKPGPTWPSTHTSLLLQVKDLENARAWQTFVATYGPLVYRFCLRRHLQDADARDVTQDVFHKVWQGLGTFEYDRRRGRFRGWLGKIVRNEIARFLERNCRSDRGAGGEAAAEAMRGLASDDEASWIEDFNAHVYASAIERIRAEFDPETWQAFESTWVQDRKPLDVAEQMNRKPAWVYKAKFRVLRRLRNEVEFLASDIAVFVK